MLCSLGANTFRRSVCLAVRGSFIIIEKFQYAGLGAGKKLTLPLGRRGNCLFNHIRIGIGEQRPLHPVGNVD